MKTAPTSAPILFSNVNIKKVPHIILLICLPVFFDCFANKVVYLIESFGNAVQAKSS